LGRLHLHGTLLFYNIRVASRFAYSPWKTTLAVAAAVLLYLGWVVLNRHWDSQGLEDRARRERESGRRLPDDLNTDRLKILQFYVAPPEIEKGGRALLCYGAINAQTVSIEPGGHKLTASLSRCLEVSAEKTTVFTLTAEDQARKRETATVQLRVK